MRGFIRSIHVWLSHLPTGFLSLNTTVQNFTGQIRQLYAHVANESKGPKGLFLHGGGGPQVGEITCLVGVTRLFI